MDLISLITGILSLIISSVTLAVVLKTSRGGDTYELRRCIDDARREIMSGDAASMNALGERISAASQDRAQLIDKRLSDMNQRLSASALENEQKLENIRRTVEARLTSIQETNEKKLEDMRAVVDEKLQKTLDERITRSFESVGKQLEQVYRGLGEMQTLATGVGDLKKVLSNVKTRGILGELQLAAILKEILSPEQYCENVITKKGSGKPVEFAIKLPGNGTPVLLPVDAKFPADTYTKLLDAYDSGDGAAVELAGKQLTGAIKSFAKDIRDKYIDPPETTEFAVLFLPFEGLYAEAVRRGLVELLQREYKISLAGPSTMAAFLNSLQMGFRTLAIQKRSSEVWAVLGAVKTEFDKFGDVLSAARSKLDAANTELDRLVGTRTRMIQSKLKSVTSLPEEESASILDSVLSKEL